MEKIKLLELLLGVCTKLYAFSWIAVTHVFQNFDSDLSSDDWHVNEMFLVFSNYCLSWRLRVLLGILANTVTSEHPYGDVWMSVLGGISWIWHWKTLWDTRYVRTTFFSYSLEDVWLYICFSWIWIWKQKWCVLVTTYIITVFTSSNATPK